MPSDLVFDYPSLPELAEALVNIIDSSDQLEEPRPQLNVSIDEITEMLQQYSPSLPNNPHRICAPPPNGGVVTLITGVAGSIGSHILASVLADDRISRIYVLVRKDMLRGLQERLQTAFIEYNLPVDQLKDSRLICLAGEPDAPMLGLDDTMYHKVCTLLDEYSVTNTLIS